MDDLNKLCQLVIRNMEVIETAPEVIETVEKRLFAAMNARIEKAIREKKNWDGCYDLAPDNKKNETTFMPQDWPQNKKDGEYKAVYSLTHTEESAEYEWLSCATGAMKAELCFAFELDYEWFDFELEEYKNKLEIFHAGSDELQRAGFFLAPSKQRIVKPFHFKADKLAGEYPGLGDSLAPLDAALEDLFKAHGEFDKFVKQLG